MRLAREAGALVELGWAQENLAVALGVQGDVPGAVALLAEAVATCRALRLDQLAYLLGGQAISDSYSTDEGVEEKLAEAEALMDTFDLRLHTTSIRADIALRAGRYEEAVEWLDRTREMMRSLPGAVPIDALCWRVWALAAVGRHGDADAALEEARQMPDLARWYGRPVVVAAGAALLEGDADGVDRAIAAAPGIMPMDIALDASRRRRRDRRGGQGAMAARGTRHLREGRCVRSWPIGCGKPPRRRRPGTPTSPPGGSACPTSSPARGSRRGRPTCSGWSVTDCRTPRSRERLYVSVRTVEAHVSSLLTKLQRS